MKSKFMIMGCLLASAIYMAGCGEAKVSDSTAPVSSEATTNIDNTENTSSATDSEPATNSGAPAQEGALPITWTIETETRTNAEGKEIVHYDYPVFSAADSAYDEVVKTINKPYQDGIEHEVDMLASEAAVIENALYTQEVFNAYVYEQDGLLFVSVGRTQEVGGPHPNNYYESYVISTETKNFVDLNDIVPMDDERIAEIVSQVIAEHPDKDADVLESDIKLAIDENRVGWNIKDKTLVVWFDYDDITGAYHGDGEYAATLSLEE